MKKNFLKRKEKFGDYSTKEEQEIALISKKLKEGVEVPPEDQQKVQVYRKKKKIEISNASKKKKQVSKMQHSIQLY